MFNVKSDSGITSAHLDGKYIDAGVAGHIAGIEFSATEMRMSDAPREQRHANAVVTLDCTPQTLLQIATVILDRLDLPAFNNRQWRAVSAALRHSHEVNLDEQGDIGGVSELKDMADLIDASVENLNKHGIV